MLKRCKFAMVASGSDLTVHETAVIGEIERNLLAMDTDRHTLSKLKRGHCWRDPELMALTDLSDCDIVCLNVTFFNANKGRVVCRTSGSTKRSVCTGLDVRNANKTP